ncbi:MAG: bleomycin resistance protein [Vulcanimicrobiota bacterium]
MSDRVTANLPALDLDQTEAFYQRLGFSTGFKDEGWMVMHRGALELEFFPHSGLVPGESWFSACVRVNEVDSLYQDWCEANLPEQGIPRLTPPKNEPWGLRQANLIDCNGSLLRILGPVK